MHLENRIHIDLLNYIFDYKFGFFSNYLRFNYLQRLMKAFIRMRAFLSKDPPGIEIDTYRTSEISIAGRYIARKSIIK